MTVVSMCSVFQKVQFHQMVEEYIEELNGEIKDSIKEFLNNEDYIEPINYSQILDIRKNHINRTDYLNGLPGFIPKYGRSG